MTTLLLSGMSSVSVIPERRLSWPWDLRGNEFFFSCRSTLEALAVSLVANRTPAVRLHSTELQQLGLETQT